MVVDPAMITHCVFLGRIGRNFAGTPNARNQCHTDKPASWAAEAIKIWYPSSKPGYEGFAEAFDLADRAAPGAQAALTKIVEDSSQSGIARASADCRRAFPVAKVAGRDGKGTEGSRSEVRMAAVAALANSDPRTRLTLLAPLLADEARIVRMDAARGLAGEAEQHLNSEDRKRFETALDEYVAGQQFNAERPEAQVNLANLYIVRGKVSEAEAALLEAIEIDPTSVQAPIALSELASRAGAGERRRSDAPNCPQAKPRVRRLCCTRSGSPSFARSEPRRRSII